MDVRDGRDPARNKHCASGQGDLNTQINDLIESRKVVLFLDFSLQINIWVWNCFFICKFTLFQYFSVETLRFLLSFSAIVCWVMELNMFYLPKQEYENYLNITIPQVGIEAATIAFTVKCYLTVRLRLH